MCNILSKYLSRWIEIFYWQSIYIVSSCAHASVVVEWRLLRVGGLIVFTIGQRNHLQSNILCVCNLRGIVKVCFYAKIGMATIPFVTCTQINRVAVVKIRRVSKDLLAMFRFNEWRYINCFFCFILFSFFTKIYWPICYRKEANRLHHRIDRKKAD